MIGHSTLSVLPLWTLRNSRWPHLLIILDFNKHNSCPQSPFNLFLFSPSIPPLSLSLLPIIQTAAGDREGIVIGTSHKGVKLKLYEHLFFFLYSLYFHFTFLLPPFHAPLLWLFIELTFCNRPNGITFLVTKEKVEVSNISVGDIVTFSYENNAKRDVPANPRIFRIRTDLLWKDVVQLFYKEKRHLNGMNDRRGRSEGGGLGQRSSKKQTTRKL